MHIDRVHTYYILHFEFRGITTLSCDLRGMKMVPADVIVVLAQVYWLKYIQL